MQFPPANDVSSSGSASASAFGGGGGGGGSTDPTSSSKYPSSLTIGTIAGIVVGCGVALAVLAAVGVTGVKYYKKKHGDDLNVSSLLDRHL